MTFRPSRKPWGPDGPKASPGGGSGQPAPKFQEESVLEVHVITSAPGVHSIKAALCAASPHVSVSFFNCKSNPIPRKHLQAAKDAAEQADLTIFFFTGVERALLQYPSIHYDWWKIRYPAKRDLFKPALFGENLSDNRWHEKNICIGDIFRWGDAVIQVSQPRSPCYKLSRRTGCDTLALAMQQNARCGWLYRVLQPGTVGAGMPFRFAERVSSVTVHEVMSVMFGNETGSPSMRSVDWQRLAETEGLSARWRKTLFRRIESGQIESWDARLTGQGI